MQINWFPEEIVARPGRLGLTNLPGGRDASRDTDLDALQACGVNRLLCLVEAHELRYLDPAESIKHRKDAIEQRGIAFMHHPTVDFDVPSLADAQDIIDCIDLALKEGESVIMHCWAGLGRAGTMAACLLIRNGMGADEAITTVRTVRQGAIQSESQERFIFAFAKEDNPVG